MNGMPLRPARRSWWCEAHLRNNENPPPPALSGGSGPGPEPTALVVQTGAGHMLPPSAFSDAGMVVKQAEDFETAAELLAEGPPRLLVAELSIGGKSAQPLVEKAAAVDPRPVIVIVATNDQINAAAEAMRAGADDCLFWPFSEQRLANTISMAQEAWGLPQTGGTAARAVSAPAIETIGLIGPSARMGAVLRHVGLLAASDISVLLTGGEGCGKAQVARYLHEKSPRASAPFVRIDCATLTAKEGAGALFGAGGAFSRAAQGTLYFENLDVCGPDVQAALAHHLEALHARKGPTQAAPRLVSGAGVPVQDLVERAGFSPALFAWLCEAPVGVPALAERREDIAALAARMAKDAARAEGAPIKDIEPNALAWLEGMDWPGNLAQLAQVIAAALADEPGPQISQQALITAYRAQPARKSADYRLARLVGKSLEEIEEIVIDATIRAEAGSLPRAAAVLGVSPSTLYRKRAAWARRGAGDGAEDGGE